MSKMGEYAFELACEVQDRHPDWSWEECMNYITGGDQNEDSED